MITHHYLLSKAKASLLPLLLSKENETEHGPVLLLPRHTSGARGSEKQPVGIGDGTGTLTARKFSLKYIHTTAKVQGHLWLSKVSHIFSPAPLGLFFMVQSQQWLSAQETFPSSGQK